MRVRRSKPPHIVDMLSAKVEMLENQLTAMERGRIAAESKLYQHQQETKAAIGRAYDTGYSDGHREGVFVALCHVAPGHTKALADYAERIAD